MPIERVTVPLLRRILSDKRVLSGLERAIQITEERGLETVFPVYKRSFTDLIYPSDHIEIGNPTSAGGNIGMNYARELFLRETGKDSWDDDNVDDYLEFCMKNGLDMEYVSGNNRSHESDYPLLNFHVRREGRRTPSKSDLEMTRRYMAQWSYARPITCVVSTEDSNPLFLLQAKTNEWENVDFNHMKRMFEFIAKSDDKEIALLLHGMLLDERGEYNPFHISLSNYEGDLKRFTFYPGLKRFEYETEVDGRENER